MSWLSAPGLLPVLAMGLALAAGPVPAQSRLQFTVDPAAVAAVDPQLAAGINQLRQAQGLPALTRLPQLDQAAAAHAADMARHGYFTHQGRDGSTVMARVLATGLVACMAAENLAFGQITAERTADDWMGSPGHRANILRREATHVGAARATAGGRPYWVAVFARPC